ncbi:MAG: sensor histidine kinase [Blautia sp.]|nr:sensor histidine kinase [Clostridia bacterium]MDY4692193.1 sensor histidine kinase [Blautia sp.]MDY5554534.1 sensor histidine kinase [Blautia sp.]
MYPISAGASGNTTAAVLNLTGKEPLMRKSIIKKFKNLKYRHKLTILLVTASLVPMTVLAIYSHFSMSRLVRENELEDTSSILEQTRETIDSQIDIFTSLINYLTYSPDIEEIIDEKNMDSYVAYQKYTQIVDPLLTVPKSYHDAIRQIRLYADSIKVRHEYTLAPLDEIDQEWWSKQMSDDVNVQWIVNRDIPEIAAVRRIYRNRNLDAILCVTLDYNKIFKPLKNVITQETGCMILDKNQNIVFRDENIQDKKLSGENRAEDILKVIQEKYVAVNSVSRENQWNFYLYKSRSLIEKSVYQLLLKEIPLILICVLIIFSIGMCFSRLFTRKIELLTENMDRVNHGSREVTVYSDSQDEVGMLIRSFRRMMEQIDKLISEVYENKIALKEFELKALTAQINPHFLYNSLSIINWMAIKSNQKEISKVTLALSTFYRTALSKGEDMVTVENCIRNIQAYLEIQLVMHDNDFTIQWKIDSEIKDEKVPKLILQPVVENALEHGLDMKEEGEKVLILSFLDEGKDVLLMVEDNGPGMEPEVASTLVTYQAEGYGLKNVNDRICLLYGEKYAIHIVSHTGEGTRVEIRIPKGVKP